MRLDKEVFFISAIVLIFILLFSFVEDSERVAPQLIYFRVLDEDKNPIANATCKADIKTESNFVDDKSLVEIKDILLELDDISVENSKDRYGYYKLGTELDNSYRDLEIKIVCISFGNKNIGYAILNNTNIPCEPKEGGKVIIC